MSQSLKERLSALGIDLPQTAPKPGANFLPVKRVGNLLYVSGQVPVRDGVDQYVGKLGRDVTIEDGQAAARLCAVNLLAQVDRALEGDLSRLAGCVRLGGFVNATEDFTEHPKVINGASDLVVAVLGDIGRHTRAAVGCISLPRNVAVELEGVFELT
ncbi:MULTISPECIES: RidA family protein [unclassified Burkholderia]|uniref:RidA family protein n=1 Tax=unclassified Burkholderia TaxID=2613784 RepID=UPI000F57CF29|nr:MULTISPECIES: RidA family protein [unclassified Burkholderia]RQR36040.1 RidA family protein [Burkholderia sp. Bp9142]RQR46644.1 RidA family protein [Burkholderia sp. Bp9140]